MSKLFVPLAIAGIGVWFIADVAHILNSYSEVDGLVQLSELGGRFFLAVLGVALVHLVAAATNRLR